MSLSTILELYSEIAVSRKPFGTGHMYIYTFLLRMTNTMTSKNSDLSPGTLCIIITILTKRCLSRCNEYLINVLTWSNQSRILELS
jgi:hypothetical protein